MKITDEMIKAFRTAWDASLADHFDPTQRSHLIAAIGAVAPLIATQVLRDAADLVDRGPAIPLPPSIISTLLREKADGFAAPSGGPTGGTPNG